MNDKPTAEWTLKGCCIRVQDGAIICVNDQVKAENLRKYHNAALDAEREAGVKALAERSFELHECQNWLGELLAVIHCDGGHYQAEHGTEKAVKDAISKRTEMVMRIDELENQLAAERCKAETIAVEREKVASLKKQLANVKVALTTEQQNADSFCKQLTAERLRVNDEVWSHEQTVKAFQKQADELREQLADKTSNNETKAAARAELLQLELVRMTALDGKRQHEIKQLREQIDAATKEAVVIKALTIELTKQLAAEREKVERLSKDYKNAAESVEELIDSVAELEAELLAEREKRQEAESKATYQALGEKVQEIGKLHAQLEAEREKVQELEFRCSMLVQTQIEDLARHKQQLDAERSKLAEAERAIQRCTCLPMNEADCPTHTNRKIPSAKIAPTPPLVTELPVSAELAVERDRFAFEHTHAVALEIVVQQLREQLDAEREKYERSQEKVREYFDLLAEERETASRKATQSKEGEWTGEFVAGIIYAESIESGIGDIVAAHKAELAAERDKWGSQIESMAQEVAELLQQNKTFRAAQKSVRGLQEANRGLYIESNERYQKVQQLVELLKKIEPFIKLWAMEDLHDEIMDAIK